MQNIAKPSLKIGNSSKRVFNSCPLDFKGVSICSMKQVNYTNYTIESKNSIDELLKQFKNSNPNLKFVNGIIGDSFYDNEESELINKPENDIWQLKDLGNGMYSVHLA
jgi:hypothetical protein